MYWDPAVLDLPPYRFIPIKKYLIVGVDGWWMVAQFRAGGRLGTGWVYPVKSVQKGGWPFIFFFMS